MIDQATHETMRVARHAASFTGTGCPDPAPLQASRFDRVLRRKPKENHVQIIGRGRIALVKCEGTGRVVPDIQLY